MSQLKLRQIDINFFFTMYTLRTLTQQQSYQYIYHELYESIDTFTEAVLSPLKLDGWIEEVEYRVEQYCYFLTKKAIDKLRVERTDLPREIFDLESGRAKKGYYTAGILRLSERLVPHQVMLNEFILQAQGLLSLAKVPFSYYDEKFVSQYHGIRPDGLLRIEDTDFFLEMDMGTESTKQLLEKWDHYRVFMNSQEFHTKDQKIVVLFITENIQNIESRRHQVLRTMHERLGTLMTTPLELYVGDTEQMLHALLDTIRDERHPLLTIQRELRMLKGWKIALGYELAALTNGIPYAFYLSQLSENKLVKKMGVYQEFVLEDIRTEAFYSLLKMDYHEKATFTFEQQKKRPLRLLLLARDVDQVRMLLKTLKIQVPPYVYFTTIERLHTRPLHEALFTINTLGHCATYTSPSLLERVYEDV